MQYQSISKLIDHALLNPSLTSAQLEAGCRAAIDYDVASVCIMPFYLPRCGEILSGTTVIPSTMIGFPHGAHTTAVKAAEARQAIADGGRELDMVVNISAVCSGDWTYVRDDIEPIAKIAHAAGAKVKVIFENAYLNEEQKIRLCEICGQLQADWAKTSTGFAASGATDDDVRLMRRHCPPAVQIKASGQIRTLDRVLALQALGVTRIGTSSTTAILDEARIRFFVNSPLI